MNENEFSEEEDGDSDNLELGEEVSVLSLIEGDFKTTLEKIQDNEELTTVRDAYTKLFDAFVETYHNEKDLMTKTEEQADQINIAIDELDNYKRNADLDSATMRELKEQLKHAKHLTDDAHAREQQAQEIIENMRQQIVKISTELELKSRLAGDADEENSALNKTKEGFEREKQRMIDEITSLKQKLTNALSYSEELEHKNSAADIKTTELNILLEQEITESSKRQRQVETLDGEITKQKADMEHTQAELHETQEAMETSNQNLLKAENTLKDQKLLNEKLQRTVDIIQLKYEKFKEICSETRTELQALKEKHAEQTRFFRKQTDECILLRNEISKLHKCKDGLERKVLSLERSKFQLEAEKEKQHNNFLLMEREILVSKKKADQDSKDLDNKKREIDVLRKNLMRLQGLIEEHTKLIRIQELSKRKLESSIRNYITELIEQRKFCKKLEKYKNKAVEESLDLAQKCEDANDEIKIKEAVIADNKKLMLELEGKLRQQQNLFESIRVDRNSLQKQLLDVASQVSDLKGKYKISIHQSEQLKEDISTKEELLLKEENILRKINKEKENLKIEVQTGINTITKLKNEIELLREKEKNLTKFIQENEVTIKKLSKQLEQVMNDKDIIGAQLVRRNDEIGLLYDKINILEVTLHRGEGHYNKRLEDIRILKLEIKRLLQEKDYLNKSMFNMTDLKNEVFLLERELAQERLKCRALEEELQHPMNIHRWRKLEGSDPHVVELLRKIQILQKRLLTQTAESIEREKQLKESEKLYLSLRQILARQPGPDIKNELIKTQKALASRGTKMKCLISELNMYETQAMEYKMDIDKISKELKDTKKKYFKQKKVVEESHLLEPTKLPAITPTKSEDSQTKFLGGGFKMMP